jgi:hypothetical protein
MKQKLLKVIAGAPDRPLVIGDVEIPCYVLEDKTRVFSQRGLLAGVGMGTGGSKKQIGAPRMVEFVGGLEKKGLNTNNLAARLNSPVCFLPPRGGRTAYGYPATLLADVCDAVLEARTDGILSKQHAGIVGRCELLMRGFARVGLIALVDEATGYQEIRDRLALHEFLDKFLLKERSKWAKRFPDEFYKEIFRLRGWPWQGMKINRPQVVAHYTNNLIWDRLQDGIRKELERRNPIAGGQREHRHHQWLTHDIGHPALQEHLIGVMVLMKSVQTEHGWDEVVRRIQRVYPKVGETPSVLQDE